MDWMKGTSTLSVKSVLEFDKCLICKQEISKSFLEQSPSLPSSQLLHVAFILGRVFQVPEEDLERRLIKLLVGEKKEEFIENDGGWLEILVCDRCHDLVRKVVEIHEEILQSSERIEEVTREIFRTKRKRRKVRVVAEEDEENYGGDHFEESEVVFGGDGEGFEVDPLGDFLDEIGVYGGDDLEEETSFENPEPIKTPKKRGRPRIDPTCLQPKRKVKPKIEEVPVGGDDGAPSGDEVGIDDDPGSDFQVGSDDSEVSSVDLREDSEKEDATFENPELLKKTPSKIRGRPRKDPSLLKRIRNTGRKCGRPRIHPPPEERNFKFKRLICPICNVFKCSNVRGEQLLEHLQTCTWPSTDDSHDNTLTCTLCKGFQCPDTSEGKLQYSEHIGHCRGVPNQKEKIPPLTSRIFVCEVCPQTKYMKLEAFLKHYVYHKKYIYKCAYSGGCEVRTLTRMNMSSHWRSSHDSDPLQGYKATPFSSRYIEDTTLPSFLWYCLFCHLSFPSELERNAHILSSHSIKPELTHPCPLCSKAYPSQSELDLHQGTEHVSKLNLLECKLCSEFFTTKALLREHRMEAHKLDLFCCDVCNFTSKCEYRLRDHKEVKHSEKSTEYLILCDECDETFIRRETFRNHKLAKHFKPDDPKTRHPLECPHCQKMFNHPNNLRIHVETKHENKFRFSCHICGQGMASTTNLKRHLAIAHGEGNYGKVVCAHCSHVFPNRYKYNLHIAQLKKEPRFKCQYCGHGFYRPCHFRRHLLIHEKPDYKPYQCKLCPDKRFRVKEHLKLHWNTHPEPEKSFLKSVHVEESRIDKVDKTVKINDKVDETNDC